METKEKDVFNEICEWEATAQTRYCSETKQFSDWLEFLEKDELLKLQKLYEEYYGVEETKGLMEDFYQEVKQ
jgi:hypothetical protein